MDTIIRATALYWILLTVWRMLGRRTASQLSPFELIVIFILGGITIQAIVADDRSVVNAVAGVFTIAANHMLASIIKERSTTFRKLMDGTPVVVVTNGEIDDHLLHGLRMVKEDVLAAARQEGLRSLDAVRLAIVERDGNITVFSDSK
jgi:uncharacterized membrane protein YcaP (DUF421 family)